VRIAVIGAGYVGLVTGAGLASLGHEVAVGERDPHRLSALQSGSVPFYEPDLDRLVAEGIASGALTFHSSNRAVVRGAEIVFVAVPTPEGDDGGADTSIVVSVVEEIAPHLEPSALLVLKSTMPMGSAEGLRGYLRGAGSRAEVVTNPEFLREGSAVADFFKPDRIVIGGASQPAVERMTELYRKLDAPVVVTDSVSAELIKYASNAYLATRITFANAIASLCESVGADVRDVLLGMGYDRRIGFRFFDPGPGFGGSCLPKDTRALVAVAEEHGYDFALLRGVIEANEIQLDRMVAKVARAVGDSLAGTRIGMWGLAFKAGTDDVRQSPAVELALRLVAEGAAVTAYDPQVRIDLPGVDRAPNAIAAVLDADVLVIATEWAEFQAVDFGDVKAAMSGTSIVDTRNILDPDAMRRLGLTYEGVGR
jgi:UDPglucose 6-dehydrogenase